MIILRARHFSNSDNKMIKDVIEKLDKDKVLDYEVTNKIPNDVISITSDLDFLRVYIPIDMEYSQYGIDDYIRSMIPYLRTSTVLDRNIYMMKLSGKLTKDQYIKLIKYIIKEEGFCSIIDNN